MNFKVNEKTSFFNELIKGYEVSGETLPSKFIKINGHLNIDQIHETILTSLEMQEG